jgi:hypothetical protein
MTQSHRIPTRRKLNSPDLDHNVLGCPKNINKVPKEFNFAVWPVSEFGQVLFWRIDSPPTSQI